ncbi:MAG: DinB family protein [Gemmatimonadota bacterium]
MRVDHIRDTLDGQLDTAWTLLELHLAGLDDEECLWRPAARGPHVHVDHDDRDGDRDGVWRADWPEREDYALGPPSVAWLTWHIGFWWSMALDHSFGGGTLRREDVTWPGGADAARAWLTGLREDWRSALSRLSDDDWRSAERVRWPFTGRPFHRLAGWLNLELMKNAAEIGYCRFLYAARRSASGRSP